MKIVGAERARSKERFYGANEKYLQRQKSTKQERTLRSFFG